MKDLYKPDEYCMGFSNETLEKYFFDKIKNEPGVELNYSYKKNSFDIIATSHSYSLDGKEISSTTIIRENDIHKEPNNVIGRITCVTFDGEKESFDIHFFNSRLTSMFIWDEHFMFLDDFCKEETSDWIGCIVYEGYLRDKTHEQILEIFIQLFKILNGVEKIEYEEHLVLKKGFYRKNNYTVKLYKPNCEKQIIQFENILFLIN